MLKFTSYNIVRATHEKLEISCKSLFLTLVNYIIKHLVKFFFLAVPTHTLYTPFVLLGYALSIK